MARSWRDVSVRGRRAFQLSALFLAILTLASDAHAFTFTTFDVPGASHTYAYGINGHGQVVGYYRDTNGLFHGFVTAP